jgi:type IV fimbrial biogenesis protein FimT
MPRETGITLVELLCALAIGAIVLAFGAPSMGRLLAESQVRAHSSALSVALAAARLRAIERRSPVSLCPLDAAGRCVPAADWSAGWMVFDDPRRAGQPSSPAAVIEVRQAADAALRIASTGGRRLLTFRPDGTSAGSNVTLTLCHAGHPGVGRQVVVSNVGRARSGPLPRGWECRA